MVASARAEVLVLGVGGMGAAALAHLAARGVRAIGIEQDAVPSLRGSSVGESRIIRKAYFEDPRYVPLLHRAYELWHELEADAVTQLMVRTGCLTLGPAEHPAIRGVLDSVTRYQLPHDRWTADEIRARFPVFAPAAGDVGVYEQDAGYLRVEACTRAHAARAQRLGAVLHTGRAVRALAIDAHGVRATLDDGTVLDAAHAVISTGAWLASAPAFHELVRELTPLTVERQVQLWFRPADAAIARAPAMPAFIHFTPTDHEPDRAYYGIPLADPLPISPAEAGLKVCRHHDGERTAADTLDREVRDRDVDDVRGYLRAHLPTGDRELLAARVCMYTNTPDFNFVVGPHPRWPHVTMLGGFSGHGYKMASVIGEIAADLVTRGASGFDLALFDPGRLSALV